jgi:hypothetical protein
MKDIPEKKAEPNTEFAAGIYFRLVSLGMNQHSPGRRANEDDIEMVGIQQNSLAVENGDADTQDDDDADDNQALLRPRSSGVPRHLLRKGSFVKIWPQIKGIVVEVRAEFVKWDVATLNSASRVLLPFS